MVEANLFARITRILKGTANNLVSGAEDPMKILDQAVLDMQGDLIKMRQAAAQVIGSQRQLEAKFKQAQATADEWLRRAELAVSKNEDELAREALSRRKGFQMTADAYKVQLDAQQKAVDQLLANTRMLENKVVEAKSKKDTLKARAASAQTSKQIQEMVQGLNTSSAMVAFDKMEEKVLALEAETEAVSMLAPNRAVEDKFALLEMSTVDDELALLKKGKQAPAALPAGRPIRDAIDMELEELRRKAKN